MTYDLFEHRHRFAIWAAARATQRGFTRVETLREALESTDIRNFVRDHAEEPISNEGFLERHRVWCQAIVDFLTNSRVPNASFGRAAKLIAVYLKSMIVVGPHCTSDLARVAHPPIDRILLRGWRGLTRLENLPKHVLDRFRTTNWTTLTADEYYSLIEQIREFVPDIDPFWHLERYWTVTQEPEI